MSSNQRTAAFFAYVWPEPQSSAAGVRTRELMRALKNNGWKILVFSPSRANPFSEALVKEGFNALSCPANASEADAVFRQNKVDAVIYDRFVMEEQFGWRAREAWPFALHIVDTQDLHSLRRFRESWIQSGKSWKQIPTPDPAKLEEDFIRELSSLYRADAVFVVSSFEENWLLEKARFPREKILCLPFSSEPEQEIPPFIARAGFAFLGNYRHPPNLDGAIWLTSFLWPKILEQIPDAELHLYGAYPPRSISHLHGKMRIFAHGPVDSHRSALMRHRVALAPLRFGAGIKGKVLESLASGTPVVGTPIAWEGIHQKEGAFTEDDFVTAAVELHQKESFWKETQERGLSLLGENFQPQRIETSLSHFIESKISALKELREELTGRMLRHHQQNSLKYFSRWIEEKNNRLSREG